MAGVLAGLLALVVVALLLLPRFVNTEKVKARILARVSQQLKGEVDFKRVDVRFFPSIRAVVLGGRVRVPGTLDVSMETLQMGIRFLPLLRGRVEPAYVDVRGVRGWVRLKSSGKGASPPLAFNDETLGRVLSNLSSKAPGLRFTLQGGELTFYREGVEKGFPLSNLQAGLSLPSGEVSFVLSFSSPVVSTFQLKGRLGVESLKGEVEARVKGLHLSSLLSWFSLPLKRVPREALVNLRGKGKLEGLEKVDVAVVGSLPRLVLRGHPELSPIVCRGFKGDFTRRGKAWRASLESLVLDYPRITLAGEFSWDPGEKKASLVIRGRGIDVPSVRKVALSLMGGHHTVQKILHIVRGGEVPSITFRSHGPDLGALDDLDNMVIQGSLKKGTIVIPHDLLTIQDAGGRVTISKGILKGEDLVGRLGNSRVLGGTLKLGLRGGELPLYLEAKVDADLSQLPRVLGRVLKGGILLSEIRHVKGIRGRALGRLVLGETTRVKRVEVEARLQNLSCRYDRVPYPIKVEDGTFTYKGSHIEVKGLRGSVGRSTFSRLSARIAWGRESGSPSGLYLRVSSMEGSLVLDEIYPWLVSYKGVREALAPFSSMKGVLRVASLTLHGPPLHPEKWKFQLQGGVQDFSMDFVLFPDTLRVKRGLLSMTPKTLAFKDCEARLLDTTSVVSGTLEDYIQGVRRLELFIGGEVGPRAAGWIYRFVGLPREFRVKAPFALKGGRLSWERGGKTDFSGRISVGNARADVDLELLGNLLLVRRLVLAGPGSLATIGVTFQGDTLSLNFKGSVTREVLDTLLEKNLILKGQMKGDFALYLDLGKMADFSAKGDLEVQGLTYLWGVRMPLGIEEARVKACGTGLDIEKASLSLKHSSLEVVGKAKLVGERLRLDLDLSSPSIDMKEIEDFFSRGESATPRKKWDLPLEGEVRARVFSLFYQGYTWSPVKARVLLFPNRVEVVVEKALLCGISTPGTITFVPGRMALDLKVKARRRDFDSAVSCLFGKEHLVRGTFSLKGYLKGLGEEDPLAEDSRGEFRFKAKDGRVYRLTLLSKIFAILNVTEIFRGKLPDLAKEGFAYRNMEMKARFKNGVLLIDEGFIDGSSMRIFADGKIDFVKNRMNLTVLVAPFKTLDTLLSRVPVLGRILTGKSKTLVSIPVKVTGKLEDPTVVPLSPTAVGSGILGIMKRTLEAPVRIILPSGKKGE